MEQDLLRPEKSPRINSQAFSPLGCFLAASGVTLLTLCLLGAAAAAGVWAISSLMGLPDFVLYGLLALSAIPVIWATIWVGGRAWHVEKRLASHKDIDVPVFQLLYYLQKA
jgi:hypothetical protein